MVDCSWEDGILYCHVEDGYFFNKEVSSYIQVEIPRKDTTGDAYSCWLDGSDADELAMCFLETESEGILLGQQVFFHFKRDDWC